MQYNVPGAPQQQQLPGVPQGYTLPGYEQQPMNGECLICIIKFICMQATYGIVLFSAHSLIPEVKF